MKQRHICIYCEKWESGGIESFLYNILNEADFTKYKIDIVAACLEDSIFTERLQKRGGVKFYCLSGNQRNVIRNHYEFRKLLYTKKYDIFYLNAFHGMTLYYLWIAKRMGIPKRIAHSHNTQLRKSITKPLKLLIHFVSKRIFARFATDFWACSKQASEFLFYPKILEKREYRFIPNGIDINRFIFDEKARESIRKKFEWEEKLVIGHIGRLCYQKNQDFLLEVFAEVKKRYPNSILLLIGEGNIRFELEKKAKNLGVYEEVYFYGTSNEVERLFCAMDIFLFPSRFEGLGIAAIEAQVSGVPVICSQHIPREAKIGAQVITLQMELGAFAWADKVIEISRKAINRMHNVDLIQKAGFDIGTVSKMVQDEWEKDSHN